ncbi:MAG: response regulator [bacterium]
MEKQLQVLILEDIPIDAELTEHELKSAKIDCIVQRVATKSKFMKELEESTPDVILADFTLPQFSGLEALRIVREMKLDIPFILVTGTQREEVAVECMKEGADDYILKTSLKRLPAAVLNALKKKEAERASRRLETELQKSINYAISIFDSITDAFFAVDNDWILMYLNPRSDTFLSKVHKQREDLWGKNWWDEFPISFESEAAKQLFHAMNERTAVEFEEYYPSLESWLHIRAYPADPGLSIYAQDVTERKLVEKVQQAVYKISEAASNEKSIDALFKRIHEIICELMQAKNFYIALYDKERDLIRFPYWVDEKDTAPGPRKPERGMTEYVLRNGVPLLATQEGLKDLEIEMGVSPRGTPSVDWLGVPLKTVDGVIGVLAVQSYTDGVRYSDVDKNILVYVSEQVAMATERKRSEEKIIQQANLLDIAQDAIMVLDMAQNILYWNKSAERIYGWLAEEVVGENANRLLQKDQESLNAVIARVREKKNWFGELKQVTKDHRELIVENRWSLVHGQDGKSESILVIATDISEKKRLEQQFLRAQRLESIGTLASGLAHDLNNVLAPIIMAIPFLKEKLTEKSDLDILATLQSSAKRGEGIVKQVLSFVRGVEGDRAILQTKHLVVELGSFLKETLSPSIRIQTKHNKDLWPVLGDATQLYQVLMNLAVNARDAMPEGGTLKVEAQNLPLDQDAASLYIDAHPGRYIQLTVSDSGAGIPADIMNRIFDPFFTTKDPGKGTGLGLFTVLTIVKSHGGFVDVQSNPGSGTQFKIYIPACESAELSQLEEGIDIPSGEGQLVLVVDDEVSISDLIEMTLKSRNYRVLTAKDGTEALALYMQHRGEIDVVLMDLLMPYMDGSSTVRAMQKIDPSVKIIAMSGLLIDRQRSSDALISDSIPFMQKPFSMEKLLKTVHEVIHLNNGSNGSDHPLHQDDALKSLVGKSN